MVNKHTPAPWTVVHCTRYAGNYEITAAIHEEHEGNKRLIEAAPDLLAALKVFMEAAASGSSNHMKLACQNGEAVIAKVEGRS